VTLSPASISPLTEAEQALLPTEQEVAHYEEHGGI